LLLSEYRRKALARQEERAMPTAALLDIPWTSLYTPVHVLYRKKSLRSERLGEKP